MLRSTLFGMISALSLGAVHAVAGAADTAPAQTPPFDAEHWALSGDAVFADYRDQHAVRISEGLATLKTAKLSTGIVAFDMLFPAEANFAGLRFRVADNDNYEYFYLRTMHGGEPDANQYTPVFNGDSGWQIYYGPEYASPETYKFVGWNHVEVRLYSDSADVFINGQRSLRIPDLKRGPGEGALAVSASLGGRAITGEVFFSNFTYRSEPLSRPADMPAPARFRPPGLVRHWLVSPALSDGEAQAGASATTSWAALAPETNGIVNLARLVKRTKARPNTIARFEVDADKAGSRLLRFGYSDKVTIKVNGEPVFMGDATFQKRDEHYLGTVGFNDAVMVPLKRGRNAISFTVGEDYGGWAAGAQFDDAKGLSGPALAPD